MQTHMPTIMGRLALSGRKKHKKSIPSGCHVPITIPHPRGIKSGQTQYVQRAATVSRDRARTGPTRKFASPLAFLRVAWVFPPDGAPGVVAVLQPGLLFCDRAAGAGHPPDWRLKKERPGRHSPFGEHAPFLARIGPAGGAGAWSEGPGSADQTGGGTPHGTPFVPLCASIRSILSVILKRLWAVLAQGNGSRYWRRPGSRRGLGPAQGERSERRPGAQR